MVNLELYRIFAIVAKEENLTRASQTLHISQPAVTKHIKNLESELEVQLFKRSKYGMKLTESGKKLYSEIKDSISLLDSIEKQFKGSRNINLGSHMTMLSRMFGNCVAKYYKENSNSQINLTNDTFNNMLLMLKNKNLDIVLSKKVNEDLYDTQKIKFISLGFLHDVFIINTNSRFIGKTLTKKDLMNETIYTPRKTSLTSIKLLEALKLNGEKSENIKHLTYATMLEILKNEDSIGIITKEYIKDELKQNRFSILKTNFKLEPMEFGFYINLENKFKELNNLIQIIKEEFIQNEL